MDNFKKSIPHIELHTINEMPKHDYKQLISVLFDEGGNHMFENSVEYFQGKGMNKLGQGVFGVVYDFKGVDGYEYAVKIMKMDVRDFDEVPHDGQILEKLQGIRGYNKLFFYLEGFMQESYKRDNGEIRNVTRYFVIMVSKKVNGYTIRQILDNNHIFDTQFLTSALSNIDIILKKTLAHSHDIGLKPNDIHESNVMYDKDEKIAVIVDVGNFRPTTPDENNTYIENMCDRHLRNSELPVLHSRMMVIRKGEKERKVG